MSINSRIYEKFQKIRHYYKLLADSASFDAKLAPNLFKFVVNSTKKSASYVSLQKIYANKVPKVLALKLTNI